MNGPLNDARQTLVSARALFNLGDKLGAVNRAYYAMFYAARAALDSVNPNLPTVKTHSQTIRNFGLHVVLPGHLASEHGRAINLVETLRISTDYDGAGVTSQEADAAIKSAELFVAAVDTFLASRTP